MVKNKGSCNFGFGVGFRKFNVVETKWNTRLETRAGTASNQTFSGSKVGTGLYVRIITAVLHRIT